MSDLRKQLLKAGLIDKKTKQAADTAARRKRKKKRKKKGKKGGPTQEEKARQENYDQLMAEKAEADRDREEKRKTDQKEKEKSNRIRNLAGSWAIREPKPGRRRWFFVTRTGIIRWFDVSGELAWKLELGAVAVVERPGDEDEPYAMVPREAAERIDTLDPSCIRFWNRDATTE